jgi:hypothetical protein
MAAVFSKGTRIVQPVTDYNCSVSGCGAVTPKPKTEAPRPKTGNVPFLHFQPVFFQELAAG